MGPTSSTARRTAGVAVAAVVAVLSWLVYDAGSAPNTDHTTAPTTSTTAPTTSTTAPTTSTTAPATSTATGQPTPGEVGGTDPDSGLPWVSRAELPPQAQDTLAVIEAGGPYAYDRDGVTFENREGLLPQHEPGYYREFTVDTPGSDDRGARRIIAGDAGERYYTDDHYESFSRIVL